MSQRNMTPQDLASLRNIAERLREAAEALETIGHGLEARQIASLEIRDYKSMVRGMKLIEKWRCRADESFNDLKETLGEFRAAPNGAQKLPAKSSKK